MPSRFSGASCANAPPLLPSLQNKSGSPTGAESPTAYSGSRFVTSNNARCEACGLVGCAFRHQHEVDSAVGLLRALLHGGFARAGGDPRGIDALLAQVLLGEIGTLLRQFRGLGFFLVRKADDDDLGVRVALQTQGHVVAHALASVVEAGCARLGVT